MSLGDPVPRFQGALVRARSDWAAADAAGCAARAGCELTPEGVVVPFFGRPHLVTHPGGAVTLPARAAEGTERPAAPARGAAATKVDDGTPAHAATTIALLHYLLTADGTPPAGLWLTFRELPDGLFYAPAFARRAEDVLTRAFAAVAQDSVAEEAQAFEDAALALGGERMDLADAAFRFAAFPRVDVAVLVWAGDEEGPGQVRVLFDAHASHYVPTEDAAGLGEWLAHRLARGRPV